MTHFKPGDRARIVRRFGPWPMGRKVTVNSAVGSYVEFHFDDDPNQELHKGIPQDLERIPTIDVMDLARVSIETHIAQRAAERIPEEPMTTEQITAEWIERVASAVQREFYGLNQGSPGVAVAVERVLRREIAPKPRVFRVTINDPDHTGDWTNHLTGLLTTEIYNPFDAAQVTVEEITE